MCASERWQTFSNGGIGVVFSHDSRLDFILILFRKIDTKFLHFMS